MSIGKKKFVFVMGGLCFLITILIVALVCFYNSNNNAILDQVSLKPTNIIDFKNIAILIQKEDGSGYEESDTFPEGMILNTALSGCMDTSGSLIDDALSYSGGIVNISVDSTSYCYLYFDSVLPLGDYLLNNDVSGLQKTLVGTDTLYRFSGTSGNTGINNYICLGTETCSDGDDNMYRIIGVEPDTGYVKVIKQTQYGENMAWYSTTGVTWDNSDIFKTVNATYFNIINFSSLIQEHSWNYGSITADTDDYIGTRSTVLSLESASSIDANIGILSLSDYYGAFGTDQNWKSVYNNYANNWIHVSNNNGSDNEWTMIRFSDTYAWRISSSGQATNNILSRVTYSRSIRPTFYLKSVAEYKAGTGTADDPFILKNEITTNSIKINSGSSYTNSATVTLTLSSSNASEMCISNSSSCTSWETYATSKSWTLTTGDGIKNVYVWYKDSSGNISEYVSNAIVLDTVAPTSNSVSINSGATATNSTSVTLSLSSDGANEVCISNTTSCSNWETYARSRSWTLNNSTNGTKTVYVWFRDYAGNTASSYVSDTITLDTVAPTITASVINNNTADADISYSTDEHTILCINKSSTKDDMTNCVNAGYTNCNSGTTWNTWDGTITESGTYYAHAQDDAGNISVSGALTLTKLQSFGEYLIANPPTGFNTTTSYGGLYRFSGTSANNYVKLGSIVYRVIGVTSDFAINLNLGRYQVKLIKSTSIGTRAWHSSSSTEVAWPSSSMYTYLQGSSVLSSTSVIPSAWKSYISSVKWNIGVSTAFSTASEIYQKESATISSSTAKIGLLYLSDYSWAYTAGGGTNCNGNACSSWLTPSATEWTMTRYGYDSDSSVYEAWYINYSAAKFYTGTVATARAVRPVFYLSAQARRTSGSGTSSDPFVLSYS